MISFEKNPCQNEVALYLSKLKRRRDALIQWKWASRGQRWPRRRVICPNEVRADFYTKQRRSHKTVAIIIRLALIGGGGGAAAAGAASYNWIVPQWAPLNALPVKVKFGVELWTGLLGEMGNGWARSITIRGQRTHLGSRQFISPRLNRSRWDIFLS